MAETLAPSCGTCRSFVPNKHGPHGTCTNYVIPIPRPPHAWCDKYRPAKAVEEVCELFLCESELLVLLPGKLYRFKVDKACRNCLRIQEDGSLSPNECKRRTP